MSTSLARSVGALFPKPQIVRGADVIVIGPLMTWAGLVLADKYPIRGYGLAALGVLTVVYNGANYLATRGVKEAQLKASRAQAAAWQARGGCIGPSCPR